MAMLWSIILKIAQLFSKKGQALVVFVTFVILRRKKKSFGYTLYSKMV